MDMTRLSWAGWGEREEGRERTRSSSQEAKDIKGEMTIMSGLNMEKPLGEEEQPSPCPWAGVVRDRRRSVPTTLFVGTEEC